MPARQAGLTGALSPLAYLAAGVGTLAIVLCFAEVSSRFQEPGGPYLYTREAFGPFVGFEVGWLTFWIRVTAVAAGLNVLADSVGEILPGAGAPVGRLAAMTAVMALITAVNLIGVRPATWAVDLFTLAKLLPLFLLILLGLTHVRAETLATQAVAQPQWTEAVLLLVFAYGGFEAPLIPAGEARDPRRDSGVALLAALGVVAAVYMLVQLVVVGVVPHAAGTRAPVAAAFRVLLGAPGATLASVAAVVSVYGYATGSVLQSPRILFSMSERGELPRALARVHPRFRTPDRAILVYSSLALGLAAWGSFEWNATFSAIARLITYGLTCAALPLLRLRRPTEDPGFRLAGGTAVAPLGVLFCLWLLVTRSFEQAWVLAAIVAIGALLWRGMGAAGRGPGVAV